MPDSNIKTVTKYNLIAKKEGKHTKNKPNTFKTIKNMCERQKGRLSSESKRQCVATSRCEVCEKRFGTRQKLSEHHNVHTGRAPVKCTLCSDTFRRYSNMVQHRSAPNYTLS